MSKKNQTYVTDNVDNIISFMDSKSPFMHEYVKDHIKSRFLLIYKYLTHSDLTNRGKRNGNKEDVDRNFLYYLSVDEMKEIEQMQGIEFESAKQSNIGVPEIFYNALGIPQLQRRHGLQNSQHEHIIINNYANVYLVNDTMKYFAFDYTKRILNALGKHPIWENEDLNVNLRQGDITPIQISHAIHGLGTSDDLEFRKLRFSMFKNDILMLLIELRPDNTRNLFVMLEKNPKFFSILGIANEKWEAYSIKEQKKAEQIIKNKTIIEKDEEEKTRNQQAKWRQLLAEEMMNYTTVDGELFCPFTYITCNYESLGTLFRASHIKAFEDCNPQEAFDINNGILICANADALFDKHLITIDENKELKFSFLIENDNKLKSQLLLTAPIFKLILNDQRMEYLKYHRKIFEEKEIARKR